MYFRKNILAMSEYSPPLSGRGSSGKLLLDFNERTDSLPKKVLTRLQQWCEEGKTQVYPEYGELLSKLSEYTKVPPQQLMFGNGSDQVLDCVFRAVVDEGDSVLLPTPSFAMYPQFAKMAAAELKTYSLLGSNPVAELEKELEKGVRLAVLCQPNNPTGTMMPSSEVTRLIKAYPKTWFLVDEAYYEFSGETQLSAALPDNLVITRTFSKAFGLAGLRFGYLIGSQDMVTQCSKIRGPYDVNQMSAYAAGVVLEEREDIFKYVHEVMTVLKPQVESFLLEKGVDFYPSRANYLLLKNTPQGLGETLQKEGILTRSMSQAELKGELRVSIGGTLATEKLLNALNSFFA